MNIHSLLTLLNSLLALCPDLFSCVCPLSICYLFSSLACPWLSRPLPSSPVACCLCLLGLTPAKLMNGYMVLTNGGSQPRSSPSLSSRTFSRPAGDIVVNMDSEPSVRKMDTVVKLDAVSFSLPSCTVELISIVLCVCFYMLMVGIAALLCAQSFLPASVFVPLLPAPSIVCINPCVVLCGAPPVIDV